MPRSSGCSSWEASAAAGSLARSGCFGSEGSRERPAVQQQVLPGDVAGVRAAEERAGGAELLDGAEAPGRVGLGARFRQFLHRFAEFFRVEREVAAQAV